MQIQTGPFAGVTFLQDQAYAVAGDRPGDAPRLAVLMPALTQAFLDKFNPEQGWAVQIKANWLQVDMFPLAKEGEVVTAAVPCVQFDACLMDPTGRAVSTASTVWTVKEPTSYEAGETNARKRLYEACGLQTRFPLPEGTVLPVAAVGGAPVVSLRQQETAAMEVIPLDDESAPLGGDPQTAEDPESVEVDPAVKEAAEASATAANKTGGEAVQAVTSAESSPSQDGEAGSEPQASTVVPLARRGKRERLPDDAPAPRALIDQVIRLARMKGREVPEVKTKGDAVAALQQLQG